MSENKWIVTAAWPYVNSVPHLGTFLHLLSGDVITRYLKLRQKEVVYVSGSDAHGTPIVVAAEREGLTPHELSLKYHKIVLELLEKWNIEFDKYTITSNENHISFVQDFHKKIHENGFYKLQNSEQFYCNSCKRFLPDRFVEGTCPKCGHVGSRGDQCNNPDCETILKPVDLINPYCATCKKSPVLKNTKHWYFDLPRLSEEIRRFIDDNNQIPLFAKQKILSLIDEGLVERPISRDMSWGINIGPIFGEEFSDKVLYVWFENVLGYVSTVNHIANENNQLDYYKKFWLDKETKTVFCLGKDNIIFHALLFPALLLANGDSYPLPHSISATNFLVFKEGPFSKSSGIGIWSDEAVELLPTDYWRYYLIANRPELKDLIFDWDEFAISINKDLNDVLGNFINRTLSFINKQFDSKIPERHTLDDVEIELLQSIEKKINEYKEAMNNFSLKNAAECAIDIARLGNQYFSNSEPWHTKKTDLEKTATILNLSAKIVEILAVLFWPIIPSTSEKLWEELGYDRLIIEYNLDELSLRDTLKGQVISKVKPFFSKVNAKTLEKKLKDYRAAK